MSELLSTPEIPTNRTLKVAELHLNWPTKYVKIVLSASDGAMLTYEFFGDVAETMMRVLNTANLTNNSLHKRTLTFILANTPITGTISGVPE